MLDRIGFNKGLNDSRTYDVHTFLGSVRKSMKKVCLSVVLAKCTRKIPFLIDDDIDMEFDVPGLQAAVKDLSEKAVKLAADFSGVRNDTIHVHRLLGVDMLQYFQPMRLINFMDGFA